jgi:membrane protease YdiL (CAAX protease family)
MVSHLVASSESQAHSPNSQAEVNRRAALGQVTWAKALSVLCGRSVLAIAAQAVVAGIFVLKDISTPWHAAAPWWSVYATMIDLGCLVLIARFTRTEAIGLRDLIGKIRWTRDPFLGIVWFLVVFPFFWAAAPVSSWLVWGTTQPNLYPGLLTSRTLPLWAVVYSFSVWWMIWSATEEMTYQAYALPRLQALSGRAWVALVLVGFWWALQHCFIPLILDWHYVAWRFLAFLPGVVVMTLIYQRTRRLPPLIFAHYLMDISGILISLKL